MRKTMKRMTAAVLAALTLTSGMTAALAEAPAETEQAQQLIGMANPWAELDSLDALNLAADVNLCLPGVMGITDIHYRLLKAEGGDLAEVRFLVNGMVFTLRASGNMEEDISGVYTENGETAFAGCGIEDMTVVTTENAKLARWLNISGQYVLMAQDEGTMDEATFRMIADELKTLTLPNKVPVISDGEYQDITSGRAHMTVHALEDGVYAIEIHWADSASVDHVWKMTGIATEDGLLDYSDCVLTRVTTAEDGTVTEQAANLIPDGWFEPADGMLYWTGAAEENCKGCVFALNAD